jgi:stress-induced morphogen
MPIKPENLKSLLQTAFPEADIEVVATAGDNDHFNVSVISAAFNGVSMVNQHKMVYDSLGGRVGTEIHALSLKTKAKQ